MPKEAYVLFSCDVWKTTDSMRMQAVFTSMRALKSAVRKKINAAEYECDKYARCSTRCPDRDNCFDIKTINDRVKYCYIETVTLNSVD